MSVYLASVTASTVLPSAVLATLSVEWWVSTEHDVGDDAQTPQITPLIIGPALLHPHVNHFRGHEFCRADRGEQLWGTASAAATVAHHATAKVKVAQLHRHKLQHATQKAS
jgi:hypothetical protein